MDKVTAEDCRKVISEKGFTRVDHHRCGGCGYMTGYVFKRADKIYWDPSLEGLKPDDLVVGFDPGCDCSSYGRAGINFSSWDIFADTFNMQTQDVRSNMWERFKAGKATHEAD